MTEFGEALGIGTREYEMVDVFPVEKLQRSSMPYIAADEEKKRVTGWSVTRFYGLATALQLLHFFLLLELAHIQPVIEACFWSRSSCWPRSMM